MKRAIFIIIVLCGILWSESAQAQNAVIYWKDGVSTTINNPDSIFFWNSLTYVPEGESDGTVVEPTETEQQIMQMTCDESESTETVYSEADSLEYDALAKQVISLYDTDDEDDAYHAPKRAGSTDDLAQEAIHKNGNNIFLPNLIIEQKSWNSGRWGNTRYSYDGFKTFYNTFRKDGKRHLLVVFYYKGGFPNKRTAYLKLEKLNSGKIVCEKPIYTGQKYACLSVCIDDYIQTYGCVNFFPLLITEGSKARNYLNPFFVKSNPIIDKDWRNKGYGYEFGKINGVSVYCNTSPGSTLKNIGGKGYIYQCVELCSRYVTKLNENIKRKSTDTWGDAIQWPEYRKEKGENNPDKGKYLIFDNDGLERVREGDLIVWQHGTHGHIGVVIKTTKDTISIAHQNGADGIYALPIGTKLKVVDKVIKDLMPDKNRSPIFKDGPYPIPSFIRINHFAEHYTPYNATMTASTTNIAFGGVKKGTSVIKNVTIKNIKGTDDLTVSSITTERGEGFSINTNKCTIKQGESKTIQVTFTPSKTGEYKDRIVIRSNADDNPIWCIKLSGTGI